MRLHPDDIEAIATRVATRMVELEAERRPARLANVAEAAAFYGVDESTIRRHADELGVIRVGKALRFDLTRTPETLDRPEPSRPRRRRRAKADDGPLLPIGTP